LSAFRGVPQARAIGAWTAWTSTAFLVGPLLGGLLVDLGSWRLVFAINVLPIAVTLVLLARLPADRAPDADARVDMVGAVLGVLGIGLPVFALIEQANFGFTSPVVLVPLIVGVAAFAAFLGHEHRTSAPMMPLSLFRVRNFWVGNIATTFIYGALSLGTFVLAVFLQQTGGYSATAAGLALLPVTVFNIVLSALFGTLAGRFGPRLFMTVGPIIAGAGFFLLLRIGDGVQYWSEVLPGVLIFGLGLSITVAPLTSAILGAIDSGRAGIASAVNNAVSRVAGLVAIAAVSLIVGAQIDLDGLHRALIATGTLLVLGGLVSAFGIRNPVPAGR
ncbi:MAG: MFS transporter, partial [Cryobacterium sp.]